MLRLAPVGIRGEWSSNGCCPPVSSGHWQIRGEQGLNWRPYRLVRTVKSYDLAWYAT